MEAMELALARQGIDVETATTDDDGPGARLQKPLGVPLRENGATRRYFRKTLEFYKVSLSFGAWISRQVSAYDLVHIHALFSFTSTAAAIAARRAGVPYVVRPLGTLMRYGVLGRRPLLKRLSLLLVEGGILRHARCVHVTSRVELEQTRQICPGARIAEIPLPVSGTGVGDAGAFLRRYPQLRGRRVILFIGRLDRVKNIEALLSAMGRCVGAAPDAMLVIGGSGPAAYVRSLHDQADRLGISERVLWTGHMDGAMKADALQAAAVFALVSLSENFGIAAAEALSAGVPCVLASGVAIADEVAQAGAGLVVQPEPAAIAAGLVDFLTGEARRQAAGRKARELSSARYSLESVGRELAGLYADVLATGTL
jgi:glycosyltransferase involved in cell wall biosynthesis